MDADKNAQLNKFIFIVILKKVSSTKIATRHMLLTKLKMNIYESILSYVKHL